MKTIVKKTMFAAAALLLSVTVAKAQQGDVLVLDLETALEIALNDNPTIKVANMEIERFDYVRRETVGNLLPQLSASGQYSYSAVKQEMAKGLSFGADNSISAAGNLTLPLFAPAVYTTLKMNRTQKEAAVESARSSRIDLVNQVKKAYYVILLSEQSLEVLNASRDNISETVENTRAMYSSGLASEYDLLTAEVQLSNLQPTIIQTENSIKVSKQMLKMYLSIPEDVVVEVTGTLDDYRDALYEVPDIQIDVEENSEIKALEFQSTLAKQQIKLANTARMPTLAAFGQVNVLGSDLMLDLQSMSHIKEWWWQNPVSIGLQISVPIFSGLKNTNKVKQLRNTVSQIELQKEYLRQAKELEARTALNNLIAARETMIANEKTVGQAEKAYNIAKTRFEAGAGTMLEVNSSELNVTQARMNHSQAIYDYLAALADYDKVVGKEA